MSVMNDARKLARQLYADVRQAPERERHMRRTPEQWWGWHDTSDGALSPGEDPDEATADAERRCAAWVAGDSDDGPPDAAPFCPFCPDNLHGEGYTCHGRDS